MLELAADFAMFFEESDKKFSRLAGQDDEVDGDFRQLQAFDNPVKTT